MRLFLLPLLAAWMGLMPLPAAAESGLPQLTGEWDLASVDTDGGSIRVFSAGQGPIVVILPSGGRGPCAAEPLARRLVDDGFRVVLPEPRGFGESTGKLEGITLHDLADDVARAIRSVAGKPVVLVGHAFGNRVARMVAVDHPELVRATVLLAAGGKFPPPPEVVQTLAVYLDKTQPEDKRIAAAKLTLFGPQSNPSREDLQLDCLSVDANRAQMAAARDPSVPLDYWWPGGSAPMLVIQGLADVFAGPENGRSLKADHPSRVTLVEFEGLGHEMTREKPDLIAAEIAGFIRQLPP